MPVSKAYLTALREEVCRHEPVFLRELESIVNLDSGSYGREDVNRVADFCAHRMQGLGATVERIGDDCYGDLLIARLKGVPPRILVIGHTDTVFEHGTAYKRPYRTVGKRALGPGVADMKAGILAGIHALAAVRASGGHPSVTFVFNPDEEVGSPFSTTHIQRLVPEHDLALVLECARPNGDVISARKGMVELRVVVEGRAAHAGVEPEKGRSAVLAAARLTMALDDLNGHWPGVTVNVGLIKGGSRPNVVPDRCTLSIDLRAPTSEELHGVRRAVEELAAREWVRETTASVQHIAERPTLERSAKNGPLLALAVRLARQMGVKMGQATTGGVSDANTTAGMDCPTLDGLGPIGGDEHTENEWIDLSSVVTRTTLLAAIIGSASELTTKASQ